MICYNGNFALLWCVFYLHQHNMRSILKTPATVYQQDSVHTLTNLRTWYILHLRIRPCHWTYCCILHYL